MNEQDFKLAVKAGWIKEALEFIASHNFDGADDRAIALMAKFFVYRAKEALAHPAQELDTNEETVTYVADILEGKKRKEKNT